MDTYFFMLENPRYREIGLAGYNIDYKTSRFDYSSYTASTGRDFENIDAAYADWLHRGRSEGAEWAPGKDTLLKIVLKAKDEPELIDAWISHHARIVGYENLIILDCGSTDPRYLEKLKAYENNIIIFRYRKYYINIHAPDDNLELYSLLSQNCKYLMIMDADEFLFARRGNQLSRNFVKPILKFSVSPIIFGTWLNCIVQNPTEFGELSDTSILSIELSDEMMASGTVAGKAMARHDVLFDIKHLGHNLHVREVIELAAAEAFGQMFVLHVKNLGIEIERRRVLNHLVSKGVLPNHHADDVSNILRNILNSSNLYPEAMKYVERYLSFDNVSYAKDSLNGGGIGAIGEAVIRLPDLSECISRCDFNELMREQLLAIS